MQRAAKLVGSAVPAIAALSSTGAGAHGIWFTPAGGQKTAHRATLSFVLPHGAD